MKILYLGDDAAVSTSAQRWRAFCRLGHEAIILNPHRFIPQWPGLAPLNVRTGYRLVSRWVGRCLKNRVSRDIWDLVWVDSGAEIHPSFYHWIRQRGVPVVSYVLDNPFSDRDHRKWDLYKQSLPLFDLCVFPREECLESARRQGARQAIFTYHSYDPVAHDPGLAPGNSGDRPEVVFVGTWMPERGPIMASLARQGLPLAIYGNDWSRASEWKQLRKFWRGPSIYGAEYVRRIREARVVLGLLSKGNRDLHTTRSVEVPFIGGGVFCAERTSVHLSLYREGEEAFFWEDDTECAQLCRQLLSNRELCRRVAELGRKKVIRLGLSNDQVLAGVLRRLKENPTYADVGLFQK